MKKTTLITSIIIFTAIIIISIIYNTLPRLQLNGSKNITISYRQKYEEPGVIVKNANSKYMSRIRIDSNLDTKTIGNYYIDYSLKISGKTLHVRRNIKVIDDISPVIKLNGDQIIELSINKEYIEPGYTAQDEYDGDITNKVEVIGEVDTKKYGEYAIKYKVTDNNNNTTEVNRIVKIIDEEAPKIICKTQYSVFKTNSENIIDCKAQDNFDGDITEKIEIIGEYDKRTPGIYDIKYKVKDDAGNKQEQEHKIVILNEPQYQIKKITINIEQEEYIKQLKEIIDENDTNITIYTCMEDNNDYIEDLKNINYTYGITMCKKGKEDIKEIKKEIEKKYEESNIQINKFKENQDILTPTMSEQIKEYLNEKKIEYLKQNEKITKRTIHSNTKEEVEKTIKDITDNELKEEIQYNIENKKIEQLKEIIKIHKDVNPNIEIDINLY